jgi:hypothetical protein
VYGPTPRSATRARSSGVSTSSRMPQSSGMSTGNAPSEACRCAEPVPKAGARSAVVSAVRTVVPSPVWSATKARWWWRAARRTCSSSRGRRPGRSAVSAATGPSGPTERHLAAPRRMASLRSGSGASGQTSAPRVRACEAASGSAVTTTTVRTPSVFRTAQSVSRKKAWASSWRHGPSPAASRLLALLNDLTGSTTDHTCSALRPGAHHEVVPLDDPGPVAQRTGHPDQGVPDEAGRLHQDGTLR